MIFANLFSEILCAVLTVEDKQHRWLDIGCNDLQYNEKDFGIICQCKGADCEGLSPTTTTTTTTTPKVECSDDWLDVGGTMGCVRFLRKVSSISNN